MADEAFGISNPWQASWPDNNYWVELGWLVAKRYKAAVRPGKLRFGHAYALRGLGCFSNFELH
jgi:hypothetical protein